MLLDLARILLVFVGGLAWVAGVYVMAFIAMAM